MEIPTSNTPVQKCLELAAYASQTIGQFTPSSLELQELAGKMDAARQGLALAEAAYAKAENDMIPVRVDVTLADFAADEGIKQSKRAAEMADGEANGPFQLHLFPHGTTPLVRLLGGAQVKEMRDLEGRYDALVGRWAHAQNEKSKIVALREKYEIALQARTDAAQLVNDSRSKRDLAKKNFLDVYAEVANRIRALFPRNKKKQDLFFDAVSNRPAMNRNAEDATP